jgi:hypothetical protein
VANTVEDHDGSVVEINRGGLTLGEVVVAQLLLEIGLGGTKISSSGLNYDAEGNPVFVLDNKGKDVWSKTQKKLNKAFNKLAKGVDDPYEQLQVRAIGMGDGSRNVDFPTIYEDLYGDKRFDPSKGKWSYAYETSFGLPDFLG